MSLLCSNSIIIVLYYVDDNDKILVMNGSTIAEMFVRITNCNLQLQMQTIHSDVISDDNTIEILWFWPSPFLLQRSILTFFV